MKFNATLQRLRLIQVVWTPYRPRSPRYLDLSKSFVVATAVKDITTNASTSYTIDALKPYMDNGYHHNGRRSTLEVTKMHIHWELSRDSLCVKDKI
jgi:hypothetical protein